jgi:D-sedoheptulose 7-phosphate isomerase
MLSAAANDLGYERVFARVLEAYGRPGDLLVLHSTSGNSPNLLEAAARASEIGITTVALLDRDGGRLASKVDLAICVPASGSARVQELQLAIEHAVADVVEAWAETHGEDA